MEEGEQQKPLIEQYREACDNATRVNEKVANGEFTLDDSRKLGEEYVRAMRDQYDPRFDPVRQAAGFGVPDNESAKEEYASLTELLSGIDQEDWKGLIDDLNISGNALGPNAPEEDKIRSQNYRRLAHYLAEQL